MGVRADIREEVRKKMVTKIHGPTDNRQIKKDVTILEKEMTLILANIPTTIGGGNHGHAGIFMNPVRYQLTAGVLFINPVNPGKYPAKSWTSLFFRYGPAPDRSKLRCSFGFLFEWDWPW